MKLLLAALLFFTGSLFAQTSDFLILKKKGRTMVSYFSGSSIAFLTKDGAAISAVINEIRSDTVYLQEFIVQRALTSFGVIVPDTIGSYHYKFHFSEIAAIGKRANKGFDWRGSGAALLGGGTLLTLGSGVVYFADREKFSGPLMLSAVGLGALGYVMAKGKNNAIRLGKKYNLVYMNMSSGKS